MKEDVFKELAGISTESRNPDTINLDRMSVREILEAMNREDRKLPDILAAAIPDIEQAVELVVNALQKGGRLIYVGAGTSGRLGVLDAAECPPTFGTEPHRVQGFIAGGYGALVRAVEGERGRIRRSRAGLSRLLYKRGGYCLWHCRVASYTVRSWRPELCRSTKG